MTLGPMTDFRRRYNIGRPSVAAADASEMTAVVRPVMPIDAADPHHIDKILDAIDGPCAAAFEREMQHQHEKMRNSF
jgi:hypothetical protein